MLCDGTQWNDLGLTLCILFDVVMLVGVGGLLVCVRNLIWQSRKASRERRE